MLFQLVVVFLFCSFSRLANAGPPTYHDQRFVPDFELRVSEKILQQSCLPAKPVVVVNGTSPGPPIRIKTGRVYWIRVHNDMTDKNTTMHWHGLTMATAPFSDGTPGASQWPIPPGCFFDYELFVPLNMEGTYFYHSHNGFQAVGAGGALLVEGKKKPPFKYDEERILFLQDVYKRNESSIEKGLAASPLQWSGETDMILVNGQGGGDANGTFCNSTLSTINVKPGKTYYLRFIGGTALTTASIMLEDHEFEVVEVDGFYVKNYVTPLLQVSGGERFGVLLRTKKQPTKQQYYLQLESRDRPTVTRGFAIFNYDRKNNVSFYPPTTSVIKLPDIDRNFLEYKLEPFSDSQRAEFPKASEVTRTVKISTRQRLNGGITWINNNYSWFESFPQEPYLVSLYKNNAANFPDYDRALQNRGIDPVTRVFPAKVGEVLEIVIQNTAGDTNGYDSHPWHAHGEHYWDLGCGNGTYNATENEARWASATGHPVRRDTTMLYRYTRGAPNGTELGWRAWRIRITKGNVGVWMIHCHILQHMLMGMQTVWTFGDRDDILGRVGYPEVEGYLAYGGSVTGNSTRWPKPIEYFDQN